MTLGDTSSEVSLPIVQVVVNAVQYAFICDQRSPQVDERCQRLLEFNALLLSLLLIKESLRGKWL